jgi:transcriptional regulator with XRE-family HTH domain
MRNFNQIDLPTVTHDEKEFFSEVGGRIVAYRQTMNWSQQRLGEILGLPQQTIANYETARLRVPASLLPALAKAFGVSVDELLGVAKSASKRGPAPKLAQHMEKISQLPKPKQRFVIEVIENMLAQQGR